MIIVLCVYYTDIFLFPTCAKLVTGLTLCTNNLRLMFSSFLDAVVDAFNIQTSIVRYEILVPDFKASITSFLVLKFLKFLFKNKLVKFQILLRLLTRSGHSYLFLGLLVPPPPAILCKSVQRLLQCNFQRCKEYSRAKGGILGAVSQQRTSRTQFSYA